MLFMLVTAFIGLRGEGWTWSGPGLVGWFRELHLVGLVVGGCVGIILCLAGFSPVKRRDDVDD